MRKRRKNGFIYILVEGWSSFWARNYPPAFFKPLSHRAIEKAVNLDRNARKDGRAEYPPEGSNEISTTESDLMLEATKHVENTVINNGGVIRKLESGLSDSLEDLDENPHDDDLSNIQAEYEDFFTKFFNSIASAERKIDRANRKLEHFKDDNQLEREPYIRHSWHLYLGFFILAGLIFGEAFFNAQIFADVLQNGQAAGFALAIGISIINVGLSFIVGRLVIPNLWHKSKETSIRIKRKFWASVGTLGYLALISYVNLSAGVYRGIVTYETQTTGGFETVSAAAANTVFWPFDQLNMLTFESQLFIGMGIVFATISLIDGIFFDDRYPGYGHRGRRIEQAEEGLESIQRRLKREFKDIFLHASVTAEIAEEDRKMALKKWGVIQDSIQMSKSRYRKLIASASSSVNHALEQYKAVNNKNRTQGQPSYWPLVFTFPEDMANFHRAYASIAQELIDDDRKKALKSQYLSDIQSQRKTFQRELDSLRIKNQSRLDMILKNKI